GECTDLSYPHTDPSWLLIQTEASKPSIKSIHASPLQLAPEHQRPSFSHPSHPIYLAFMSIGSSKLSSFSIGVYTHTHTTREENSTNLIWYQSQVHQNLSCSFRKALALISAQTKAKKTCSSELRFFKKKKCKAVKCSPCLSVSTVRPDGDSPWKQRSVLSSGVKLVSKKMSPRRHETRRGLEYEKQDGGHELKEKEVGDDPDSQIQQKSWPVSQNAKGINLVHKKCSLLTNYPRQEEDLTIVWSNRKLVVQDIQAEDQPLCGAMGRFLCVEAGLRSAGHEVVELLVQDTQEEEGHHLSHEEGRLLPTFCGKSTACSKEGREDVVTMEK
ncbi:hypothetical protein IGI04_007268, partial [Brassica rapa subsp. trilocularis]